MAVPLKWNQPGTRWNTGLQWNGLTHTPKTMNTRAVIDFTPYPAAELTPKAQTIHDQMVANAATFAAPVPNMPALATLLATYGQKLAARASNASADVLAFNLARHDLEGALHDLGVYVNFIAKGDPVIVEKSGFPSYATGPGATPGPSPIPGPPQDLKLRAGDLSGSLVGRCKPDRQHSFNVAQVNPGDPNNAAGWAPAANFSGGKFTISGLTVGSIVWVRVATVGPGGVVGAWSDPARIVVV